MKKLFITLLFGVFLYGEVLINIDQAMQTEYGKNIEIKKKSIILTKDEAIKIQKIAKTKINSKIFKVYIAKNDSNIIGFSVLMSKKIRSKNGVILYMLDTKGTLKGIEIIAFNEPLEYLPSEDWKKQFNELAKNTNPKVGQNIHTITGATLSAKTITSGARIAQALYIIKLKELN